MFAKVIVANVGEGIRHDLGKLEYRVQHALREVRQTRARLTDLDNDFHRLVVWQVMRQPVTVLL